MKNKKNIFSNRKILIIILFIALLAITMITKKKSVALGEEFTINGKGKAVVGGKLNLEIVEYYTRKVALDNRGYGGDRLVIHIRLKEGKKTETIGLSPSESEIWEGYMIEVIDVKSSYASAYIITLKVDKT